MDGGVAPADSPRARGPGREVGGYRLLERIGSGGMGTVYAALDADDRRVAIKLLHPAFSADPSARERLRREVASLHRVRGPHVARVLDAEADAEEAFVVTELVDGLTLEESIREAGPFVPVDLHPLALGLADALASIHGAGVVHRDLKPGNVMVTDDGPVLIDFGIAQVADDVRLTTTGFVTGTPGYLDPAVMAGEDVGEAGDWFGWAAVLLYAATGRPPFGRGPMGAVVARVAAGTLDTDGLSASVAAAFARALDPDPAARPDHAVLLGALEDSSLGREPTIVVRPHPSTEEDATSLVPPPTGTTAMFPARSDGLAPTAVGWPVPAAPPPVPPAAQPPAPPPPARPFAGAGVGAGAAEPPTWAQPPSAWSPVDTGTWPVEEPTPAWALPAAARPGLVVAGWAALAALAAVWPGPAVVIAVAGLVVSGAVGVAAFATRARRLRRGVRRTDAVRAAAASPWYLVRALLTALPGILLGGVAAAATWWLLAALASSDALVSVRVSVGGAVLDAVARALALAVGAAVAWWTPSSAWARSGARSVWAAWAPSPRAVRIWLGVLALAVVGVVIAVLVGDAVVWSPLPVPPQPQL
ncbi:serine/threonine protein kinase [Beutenbergia cavernae DSM 12333]|uniref:Serine/threonine protein kinase n=1 Tax=Beutenbergia cavernae (strain ATCC BAA-8 / DSM 12333 / CCUG 43141 / JCM 11478 / NBRC 16432 / NCIMB 13614 / HKI 0122) TaxID=471853 RepID=C5BYV0_BEUC1|nr:serine/threonine-protein kinase [Beutenbergia cavernae]ACQ79058.1 serine/threonine protein kinase [Beutenbergia cavernae DSM 12333]